MFSPITQYKLTAGYEIPRIIKGCWQLSSGHSDVDRSQALSDLGAYIDAGFTALDCGDIYTGVEELIGDYIRGNRGKKVQIHTKYVPDLDCLDKVDFAGTQAVIDRSLLRLGVESLDLVQFHWWDFAVHRYVEVAQHLAALQKQGKIRHIGVTNFDGARLQELLRAGVPVVSNQVQYSVLDDRPGQDKILRDVCRNHGVRLLAYGTMAGGFLQESNLGAAPPEPPFQNRSQTKYHLMIEEFGGWELFQELLRTLTNIGKKYDVSPSAVASAYVLRCTNVAGVIVGARNQAHLTETILIQRCSLSPDDVGKIQTVRSKAKGPNGPVYGLERDRDGPHGKIMRYDLNTAVMPRRELART
ncbi:MAG: aldo/keto reductase [Alphaproteobacteria bacterium]|nr:MAG: aldo/keto reductase [Alphaproteobacteria bacterium]